jgi:HSP20 family protein
MSKGKMLSPMVEQWPAWMSRLGFPESWQQFLDAETMKVEEYREDGAMVVRAELPGMDPDRDVEVTVVDGMLRIHAERTQETHTPDTHDTKAAREHYRSEFRYGSFTRVLPLPAGATDADVTATYRDGILEVRVPIGDDTAGARKVAISRS